MRPMNPRGSAPRTPRGDPGPARKRRPVGVRAVGIAALAAGMLAAIARPVGAQDAGGRRTGSEGGMQLPETPLIDPNLPGVDRSYLVLGGNGVSFEAQIAPPILLYESLAKQGGYRPGHSAWALYFTPMLRLRMLEDRSSPIKTLSWMPHLDVLKVFVRPYAAGETSDRSKLVVVHATWGHHSNGQDESLFHRGILDGSPQDVPPTRVDSVRINYPNGSFSTNFLRVRAGLKWHWLPKEGFGREPRLPFRTLQARAGVEWHKPGLPVGASLPAVVRGLYGLWRWSGDLEFEQRVGTRRPGEYWIEGFAHGSFRIGASGMFIDKIAGAGGGEVTRIPAAPLNALYRPGRGSSRWAWTLEGAYLPDALRGWGLMLRCYSGQDFQNLEFVRDIRWVQFGIVFDPAKSELFGSNAPTFARS